jgi:cytochrome c553
MFERSRIALIGAVALAACTTAHAAGDPAAGEKKAEACVACHGPQGISQNAEFPNLAGQVDGYIATQLQGFKTGERQNPIMQGIAAGLSEEDMRDLDAYYAKQKRPEGAATDPQLVELGQQVYRGGNAKMGVSACMSCHGPTGAGIPPHYPSVAGQLPAYAEKQLLAFKKGERQHEIMSRIAFRMSEQEIRAVSQYMYGLRKN